MRSLLIGFIGCISALSADAVTLRFFNPIPEKHLEYQGSFRSYIISDLIHVSAMKNSNASYVPQIAQVALYPSQIDQASFALQCKSKNKQSFFQGLKQRFTEFRDRGLTMEDLRSAKDKLTEYLNKMRERGTRAREFIEHFRTEINRITLSEVNHWARSYLPRNQVVVNDGPKFRFASASGTYQIRLCSDEQFLHISQEKKDAIFFIIKTMGTKGVFGLLKQRKKLEAMGETISDVPPLQFLAYIFSNDELRGYMPKIADSSFKWKNLIGGVKKTLTEEWASGVAQSQIAPFAAYLGRDPAPLNNYLEKGDIDAFVRSLF